MAKTDFILGTAGHIDHGKSSLVKALTGTDPDRLAEEKERGITITLGFAQLTLPSGRKLGIVDVPGHERFVRQMVAGATGMDIALLVVAADDGIMPQTIEHMAVLELLGVKDIVVALTKIDMVDKDWAGLVAEEVATTLESTPFAGAPIVPCSSVTGEGLDELRRVLDDTVSYAAKTKPQGTLRFPIDRVFTVKGFGTVATGTLWSGTVHVGGEVEILPSSKRSKVRSIQVHGKDTDAATAGKRVALCLADLSTSEAHPGDFVCVPGSITATDRFDAWLTYSDPFHTGKPLASGSRARVAHGTREVCGRILCMNGEPSIASGQSMLVQIRLDAPLPVSYQDRFIIRSFSPVRVIGGGSVALAHPRRRTNLTASEEEVLLALARGDTQAAVRSYAGHLDTPLPLAQIAGNLGLDVNVAVKELERMLAAKELEALEGSEAFYAAPGTTTRITSAIEGALMRYHNENPESCGMSKDELRHATCPKLNVDCFDAALKCAMRKSVAIEIDGEISHPKAGAAAKAQVSSTAQKVLTALEEGGATPPTIAAIGKELGLASALAAKAMRQLVDEGRAVRITSELAFSATAIDACKAAVAATIKASGPATAAQLKEACNTSRRYMVPLLEWMDAQGFTKRNGDVRTLG